MFPELAREVVRNPGVLQQLVAAVSESHPDVARAMAAEPDRFLNLAREVAGASAPNQPAATGVASMGVAGTSAPNMRSGTPARDDGPPPQFTTADSVAVERLMALGFGHSAAMEAYIESNRNEELASSLLCRGATPVD